MRVAGFIACFAAAALAITLYILVSSSFTLRDIRLRAADRLRRAASDGAAIWGVELNRRPPSAGD